jgi:uncharacterized protein (DUF2267 family)
MRTTKQLLRVSALAAGAIGYVAVKTPESGVGRTARRVADRLGRDIRYAVASAPGLLYRLAGRAPDPEVSDDILADRIRSSVGPLEKRLDVPHVHVMVRDHVAVLHGDVPDEGDACAIERAVMRVSGVDGVESHLHAPLLAGDTRPSAGMAMPPAPSDALRRLLGAAGAAGAHDPRAAVHAVLCGFTDRLPEGERAHVVSHLPRDVRALAGPPRQYGAHPHRLRTVPELVAAITAEGGIEAGRAEEITRAVLATFRDVVQPEADDIAAVLPTDLCDLWEHVSVR